MSEKIQKTTEIQGLTSIIFLATIICLAYSWYLQSTGLSLDFVQGMLNSPWIFIPGFALEYMGAGSYLSTLISVFLTSVHIVIWGYIGLIIALLAVKYLKPGKVNTPEGSLIPFFTQQIDPKGYYLLSSQDKTEIILLSPSGRKIKNVVPRIQIRLDRASIKFSKQPETPIEKLEAALLSTLYHHKQWPADPNGFHSDTSLYQHSINVANQLQEKSNNHPLSRIIGLAHDIGKILAYELVKEGDGTELWEIQSKRHDKLSAHIVTLMPEFNDLTFDQQNTINTVLAFSHHPDQLPQRKISHSEMMLIQKLREVDGLATREEQQKEIALDLKDELITILPNIITLYVLPVLNINASRDPDGFADGWTSPGFEYVAIQERAIRDGLKALRGAKITATQFMALGLQTPPKHGVGHKATGILLEALSQKDYIFSEFNGIISHNGMFSIKAGVKSFDYVILFKKAMLENLIGDIVEQWGDSKYKLKVKMLNFKRLSQENE